MSVRAKALVVFLILWTLDLRMLCQACVRVADAQARIDPTIDVAHINWPSLRLCSEKVVESDALQAYLGEHCVRTTVAQELARLTSLKLFPTLRLPVPHARLYIDRGLLHAVTKQRRC